MVTTKQKKSDKLLHISSDLIDLKFISCQIIESKIVKLLHNFTDVGTVTVDQVETEIKKNVNSNKDTFIPSIYTHNCLSM